MTNREFFRQRGQVERPVFARVLSALPEGKQDYRPHERSNTAANIAWILPQELDALAEIIEKGQMDWATRPHPATFQEIAKAFDGAANRLEATLGKTDEAKWESEGRFLAGGKFVFSAPIRDHSWWILFDLVHHRDQLTSYLRPMGGKDTAVYGPSADEEVSP